MISDIRSTQMKKAMASLQPIFVGVSPSGESIYQLGEKEIMRLYEEYPLVARNVIQAFHQTLINEYN